MKNGPVVGNSKGISDMSFSSEMKTELCKLESKRDCCRAAECYGLWLFSKCFTQKESVFLTEHAGTARRMLELAAETAGVAGELSYGLSRRRKPAYQVRLPEAAAREKLLSAFGHTGRETTLRLNLAALENDCCTAAFLRGAFLTCGTANDPNKEYRLEFAVPYQTLANGLYTLLSGTTAFESKPALSPRKGGYVVYLKDSGQIEDFLTYIGATSAAMELMQVRMYKEAKNNINRKANFETANMDKTYSASARQIAAIAALSDAGALEQLPDPLRELAHIRLEHPDMTLKELSASLSVSRSGVNHRLQRLLELGEKYLEAGKETIQADRETEHLQSGEKRETI